VTGLILTGSCVLAADGPQTINTIASVPGDHVGSQAGRVVVRDSATAERLRIIPVAKMTFDGCAFSDVVEYMAMNLHCVCHPVVHPSQTTSNDAVTYIIPFDRFDGENPSSPKDLLKGTNETSIVRFGPAVTLSLTNCTMLEALGAVTRVTQSATDIDKDQITIINRRLQPPPLRVQKGPVPDPF